MNIKKFDIPARLKEFKSVFGTPAKFSIILFLFERRRVLNKFDIYIFLKEIGINISYKNTLWTLDQLEKQGIIKVPMCLFMEDIEKQGFAKYMKKLGVYKTTGARETRTVWVNPYIFVMVAMDLNPIFKAEVIGWLTDSLIINRIEAGSFYKELSRAINKFSDVDFIAVAKGLNWIIFNRHELGLRNSATSKELSELRALEEKLAFAIDMGYITSFKSLIETMRKMYFQKWKTIQV
jgi:hypothetical protein